MKVSITYDDTLYQLVPKEATEAMVAAHFHEVRFYQANCGTSAVPPSRLYRAMLSAAPTPPAQPQDCNHVLVHASVVSNEGTKDHPTTCMLCGTLKYAPPAQPVERKPTQEMIEKAYKAGFVTCAIEWAARDDLLADVGSPSYRQEMRKSLAANGIKGES